MRKLSLIIVCVTFVIIGCKPSQSVKNTIYPNYGEVVFERKNVITDKSKHEESFKALENKFAISIIQ